MQTILKFKTVAIIMVFSIAFYSCAKDDMETIENTTQEDEFSSEIESLKDAVEIEGEVLFSMDYDESLTEEEASAQFDKDVKRFLKNNPQTPKKALSTEWFYRTAVRTGSQTDNTTHRQIQSRVYFRTNRGTSWVGKNYRNNIASKPGWKHQFSRGWYPNKKPVSYVKPIVHRVSLQGTDDWFVIGIAAYMYAKDQSIPAKGSAGMTEKPYKWLKANSSSSWDHYYSSKGKWGDKVSF